MPFLNPGAAKHTIIVVRPAVGATYRQVYEPTVAAIITGAIAFLLHPIALQVALVQIVDPVNTAYVPDLIGTRTDRVWGYTFALMVQHVFEFTLHVARVPVCDPVLAADWYVILTACYGIAIAVTGDVDIRRYIVVLDEGVIDVGKVDFC